MDEDMRHVDAIEWPVVADDGAMMAYCRLISEGAVRRVLPDSRLTAQVSVEIDTSYARQVMPGEFNSRKAGPSSKLRPH